MTSTAIIADVEALLAPVDAAAPAGADLRYQPIYDDIKEARRAAEVDPTELSPWKRVAELTIKALKGSKDLQLAIWLLEAFARIDGYQGASGGLTVLRRMIDQYWDVLYPEIDPEDVEPLGHRIALLEWADERLPAILKQAPLAGPPTFYGVLHYEVTQKTEGKKELQSDGWPSYEKFVEALNATARPRLEAALDQITACEAERAGVQALIDTRINVDPATGGQRADPLRLLRLKETFETASWLLKRALKITDPAPAAASASAVLTGDQRAQNYPLDDVGPRPPTNGDQVWAEALTMTRDRRVDGLRLLQQHVAAAPSGRETFLRQLQLAELSLEAGVYSLAFPVFDELARTVESRRLEEWEDRALLIRVFKGLADCCGLLKTQNPATASRETEMRDRISRLESQTG